MEKKQNWYENKSKYHFIYKTTNLVNNKYYIGMHSTNDLNDGYLGSGTRLWRSIKHYGKENFKVEILEFLLNRESLRAREAELVNEEKLSDPLCMNLTKGGYGDFPIQCSIAGGKIGGKIVGKMTGPINGRLTGSKNLNTYGRTKEALLKRKETLVERYPNNEYITKHHTGVKRSVEARKNMSISATGEKNSQHGTCWITNLKECKKIKEEFLQEYLDFGWIRGRKLIKL